jgi:hypothetical protein
MIQSDYRLCSLGDHLEPLSFSPPDSPVSGPTLEVWTFHGAPTVRDAVCFHFVRFVKDAVWVRQA